MGGEAVANGDDVSDFDGAKAMIDQAVDTFGGLDVVVNNAGILRDRMLTNMTEEEWDAVIKVHLKGTFAPARHAAAYWRERSKAGETNDARIINTTSVSGIYGNVGQTNYGAAKPGIAGFTFIAALELRALRRDRERHRARRAHPPHRGPRPGAQRGGRRRRRRRGGSRRCARGWPARSRPGSPGGCSSRRAGCSPWPRAGTAGPPPTPSTTPSRSTPSCASLLARAAGRRPAWTAATSPAGKAADGSSRGGARARS